ncbi:MAG: hypothetical protein EAZ78_14755 [Oscillatoriales cyanobacterium]|nr:MAG: hypothetical protein EAZ78_14755 [Oscillatoriales cyanobacterium]
MLGQRKPRIEFQGLLATGAPVSDGTNLVCKSRGFSAKSPIYTLRFWKKSLGYHAIIRSVGGMTK